jgi:6,7-dimethyl-8-ribityllumazine synthase
LITVPRNVANTKDAVIAIGCVIQGQTKHFDFVCEGVAQGIKDECSNGYSSYFVLTDNTMQQSIDRSGGIHGNKGTEAAIAAIKWLYSVKLLCLIKLIINTAGALQLDEAGPLELKE